MIKKITHKSRIAIIPNKYLMKHLRKQKMPNIRRPKFNKQIMTYINRIKLKLTRDLLWLFVIKTINRKNKQISKEIYRISLQKVNFFVIQILAQIILAIQKVKTHNNNIHKKVKTKILKFNLLNQT